METPSRPVLRDVPDVELLRVGRWPLSTGECEFTVEDLAAAVRAAQSPAVSRPVIKLGHTDPRFDGEPAVGFVDNLRLSADNSALVGDLRGLPAWLADIMPSAYPNRSIEGAFGYRDQTGAVHPFALTGLALLGVTPPAVGTLAQLRDVAALYEVKAGSHEISEKGIRTMPESIVNAAASVEDVRRDFYERGPGASSFMWIEEMFLNPAEVIVSDDDSGKLFKISFSVAENDEAIEWGTPEPVKREYVAASARTPDAQWASAKESRSDNEVAADTDTDEKEKYMNFTQEQVAEILEALGLSTDADSAAVVSAIKVLAEKTSGSAEPENIAAAAKQQGMRVVEAAAWEKTQSELKRLTSEANARVVDDAIKAGKLMPASRKSALSQMEKGLLDKESIEALEPIVTLANAEIGHGAGETKTDPTDIRENPIYKNWQ